MPTAFRTLSEDLRADLTMVVIMLFALVGTFFIGVCADLSKCCVVAGLAHHEAGMERCKISHISTKPEAFGHLLTVVRALWLNGCTLSPNSTMTVIRKQNTRIADC